MTEVTGPRERRRRGIDLHHARLAADEVTVHRGIPVSTPARTLLDLAAVLGEHQLVRAAERAAVRRLLETHRIQATTTRSDLERRFLTLLEAENLPRPLVNAEVQISGGARVEADFTWRDSGLIVELDGYETHSTRQAFERDRARDRALQSAGWGVLRVTSRQLHDAPHEIANDLRTLLGARR